MGGVQFDLLLNVTIDAKTTGYVLTELDKLHLQTAGNISPFGHAASASDVLALNNSTYVGEHN
ncbi:hypothetical protein Ancab_028054 [Ancistrocladus abbreviatus]